MVYHFFLTKSGRFELYIERRRGKKKKELVSQRKEKKRDPSD